MMNIGGHVSYVTYERKNAIVTITLNRPERLNALGAAVRNEMATAWRRFDEDGDARVAILTGNGRAFSVGRDLKEMVETGEVGESHTMQQDIFIPNPVDFSRTPELRKPVIAAINGFAVGAGVHLALSADLRIVAESATFSLPEIKWSIYARSSFLISQMIPTCLVSELLFLGESIAAQRAYQIGLVNRVVPDADLMDEATKIAEKIAKHSPFVVGLVKETIKRATQMNEAGRILQAWYHERVDISKDALNGAKKFSERKDDGNK
jgi:enoyl-CoA hydratase/carnithine racemase